MAQNVLIKALRQVVLFDGLAPLQITEIARRADRIVYKPGAAIVSARQPLDAAILIVSGQAERVSGPGLAGAPEPLSEGTILSEMAMLIDTTPSSSIVAITEVRALRLAREEMLRLIAEDPSLGDHFISKATGRLQAIAAEMRDIELGLTQFGQDIARPATMAATTSATSQTTQH